MLEKLAGIEARYEELSRLMGDPDVAQDYEKVAEYAMEQSDLEEIVSTYRRYKSIASGLQGARAILDEEEDAELREMAWAEVEQLQAEQERVEVRLRELLLPKDPRDEKNVIVEIRAGAGGDEAGLFASDLMRMYGRYAENQNWTTEIVSEHATGIGGYKEVIFVIEGRGAYSRLKYESGVHRVQRVPATEASGRIHTSTATVAVLPEMDEVEIEINPADLILEYYCSSGPGGQHMQKNATAVRLMHKPTGMVVTCENQRSQTQNRLRAMAVMRARLYEIEQERQTEELEATRRAQVGTGERSEKIRTYNFPQNRVTDHRSGLTLYRLPAVMAGDLDELIDEMATQEQAEKLQAVGVD